MEMCLGLPTSSKRRSSRAAKAQQNRHDVAYGGDSREGSITPPALSYSLSSTPSKHDSVDYVPASPYYYMVANADQYLPKNIKVMDGPAHSAFINNSASPLSFGYPDFGSPAPHRSPSLYQNSVSPQIHCLSTPTINTMATQSVTFSSCPQCQTWEHHFVASSRTCANCGHIRYFAKDSTMHAPPPPARTYWRPTQFASGISFAHVREGFEDVDAPILETLAAWAAYQRSYLLSYAAQVHQSSPDPSMKAFWLECSRLSQASSVNGAPAPRLTVSNQGIVPLPQIQADDLLGSFKVLQQEDRAGKSKGGRGIVVAVLMCQGASLAFAVRLDEGTI